MAATTMTAAPEAATWEKVKPGAFKGKDLSAALKAFDGVRKKDFKMIPSVPGLSLREIEDAIGILNETAIDVEKMLEGLKKVEAAAHKTVGELEKQSKDMKGDERKEFDKAIATAGMMKVSARDLMRKLA